MCDLEATFPAGLSATSRAALLIAHPGHELRVYGWITVARPRVFVLTDGSGHGNAGRLAYTAQALARQGMSPGNVFGRFTDRWLYELLYQHDHAAFRGLAAEIAGELRDQIDYLVSDAAEGFNTGHEACRLLAAAVARQLNVPLFDFPLKGKTAPACPDSVHVRLQRRALKQKLSACWDNVPLRGEVKAAFCELGGAAGLAVECLRPTTGLVDALPADPFYEQHGQRQVERGLYTHVIRRSEHLLPLALYLQGL